MILPSDIGQLDSTLLIVHSTLYIGIVQSTVFYSTCYYTFLHYDVNTSVPLSANLSMGMSAMIRAQSLNLLVGFE